MKIDKSSEEFLTYFFTYVAALQTIVTLIIAYLLYDRFGTSKKLLDKQNEVVLEFIEELRKIRLSVYLVNSETITTYHTAIRRDLKKMVKPSHLDRHVMVSKNFGWQSTKKMDKLLNHPLFPPDLKKNLDILNFSILTADLEFDRKKYAFISFVPLEDTDHFEQNMWMFPGEGKLLLGDYIGEIESAIRSIEGWVNRESSIQINLNWG
jgi:hypothetical protein